MVIFGNRLPVMFPRKIKSSEAQQAWRYDTKDEIICGGMDCRPTLVVLLCGISLELSPVYQIFQRLLNYEVLICGANHKKKKRTVYNSQEVMQSQMLMNFQIDVTLNSFTIVFQVCRHQLLHTVLRFNCRHFSLGRMPYLKSGGACRKCFKRTPQELPRSCFVGVEWNCFLPKEVLIFKQNIISYHISFSRFSILNVITKAPAVYPLMVNTLNVPELLF